MSSDYAAYNLTELAALARQISPYAHRIHGREILIDIIETGDDPFEGALSPIDIVRMALYDLVDTHWEQVRAFVTCPLRSRKPWACSSCTDIQVAECRAKNETLLKKDVNDGNKLA